MEVKFRIKILYNKWIKLMLLVHTIYYQHKIADNFNKIKINKIIKKTCLIVKILIDNFNIIITKRI